MNIQAFRTSHSLVKILGPGSKEFLQGQLSADISELDYEADDETQGESKWTYSLLLGPEGKLVAGVRVMRLPTGMMGTEDSQDYLLESVEGFGEKILERLKRFSIGAKCEMSLEKCSGIAVIKSPQDKTLILDVEHPDETLKSRHPVMEEVWSEQISCLQLLEAAPQVKLITSEKSDELIELHPEADLDFWRILCGVPKQGNELYEGIIPAVAGQAFIDKTVSFTKGCFVGQELVARIDSRGAEAPKKLIGFSVPEKSEEPEESGEQAEAEAVLTSEGQEIGEVTSFIKIPARLKDLAADAGFSGLKNAAAVGLAYIKRSTDLEKQVFLKEREAKFFSLPYETS